MIYSISVLLLLTVLVPLIDISSSAFMFMLVTVNVTLFIRGYYYFLQTVKNNLFTYSCCIYEYI